MLKFFAVMDCIYNGVDLLLKLILKELNTAKYMSLTCEGIITTSHNRTIMLLIVKVVSYEVDTITSPHL